MISHKLIVLLLTFARSCYQSGLLVPQQCTNYYQVEQLNDSCTITNNSCNFSSGLEHLINNPTETTEKQFLVCLNLPEMTIYITNNWRNQTGSLQGIQSLSINATNMSFQNYGLKANKQFRLNASGSLFFTNAHIESSKMWMWSDQQISTQSSYFINDSLLDSKCNCYGQTSSKCSNWTFPFRYPILFEQGTKVFNLSKINDLPTSFNRLTMAAQKAIHLNLTTIKISIVGIFSDQLSLAEGNIDTGGLGFPSGIGPGCGYFDETLNQLLNCMGTGGSHGGFGGNSSPQNCYLLMSEMPYDSIEFPNAPGSGGGFLVSSSRSSSAGGGVINVQARSIFLTNTLISAEGQNGSQGGGGGAGGSISLDYIAMAAVGINKISVEGGSGQKSSSGGGGRIRLWNHNWTNQNLQGVNNSLTVTVSGGKDCPGKLSCGEKGSILTSPCRPGSQLISPSYICKQCQTGYYQLNYGYSRCLQCNVKPADSYYTPYHYNDIYAFNPCAFKCNQGTNLSDDGGWCLTHNQQTFLRIGGYNTIISLAIVLSAAILYFLILLCRKLSTNDQFAIDIRLSRSRFLKKQYFQMEDIPFHVLRVYIDGSNCPSDPWWVSEATESSLRRQLLALEINVNKIIADLISEINLLSRYNRFEKSLLFVLKYTYFPLSRLLLKKIQSLKAQKISTAILTLNKGSDSKSFGLKLHIKPQMTVFSLQLFDFRLSALDFCIENYYPLHFMLEKAPFGGYCLDLTDPFLKVFINEISEKHAGSTTDIERFINEMNKYLKNPRQILSLLSHLWSLKDVFPQLQAYLWQPPDHVFGKGKSYKINSSQPLFLVINNSEINHHHFIYHQSLTCIYQTDIECFKHKFAIRKQSTAYQQKSSFWIIHNELAQTKLFILLGALNILNLCLSFAEISEMILIVVNPTEEGIESVVGIWIYFLLWPLADLLSIFYSFKAVLMKDEEKLAIATNFTIFTTIKMTIVFLSFLVQSIIDQTLLQSELVWLSVGSILIGIATFLSQILLSAKIIEGKT